MLVTRQIIITGDLAELKKLHDSLINAARVAGYSTRDASVPEGDHSAYGVTGPENIEFFLDLEDSANQIRVWPRPNSREEDKQWNHMIESFFKNVVQPTCNNFHVDATLTEAECEIGDLLPPELADLLTELSRLPPCGTRVNKYHEFNVRSAVEIGNAIHDTEIGRFLEDAGWKQDDIDRMLEDYSHADWVLKEFFKHYPHCKPSSPKANPD